MKFTKENLRSIIREEMQKLQLNEQAGEDEASSNVSKTEVQKRLLDLKDNLDMPASQYTAFLAILDEVLQLASQGRLKSKATQITKGLDRFDAKQ